ncbi:hypothetical protein B4N89_26865 [Embleya scabrispora]|uniref:Uncharacterized protein n=1 Tax=Embleya scabrispora TaxID=159449 RepID=A0A1T3P4P8_9ACTN|nr:hypothetical protein B4N89_26865 [Embleya scabrispora]
MRIARVEVSGGESDNPLDAGTIRGSAKEVRRRYGTRGELALLYGLLGPLLVLLVVVTIIGLVVLERLSRRERHSLPAGSMAGGRPPELRLEGRVDHSAAFLVITDRRILITVVGCTAPRPAPVLWECSTETVRSARSRWTDNLRRECRVTFLDDSFISLLTPGTSPADLAKALTRT